MKVSWSCLLLLIAIPFGSLAETAPIVVSTNTVIRIMASNITSGNNQRYETPGLNILKALKPDVVAVQEFNYLSATQGEDTPNAIREMVDQAFGTNFVYYRESGKNIPNGIISRFPILSSGFWDDPQVTDREFVWARLDIPGTNDLYVVSVHLHSGGGASSRSIEATYLKGYIQTNFPANAFIALAGDFNTDTRTETSTMTTLKSFLKDDRVPVDQAGTDETNAGRSKPYDYVLTSPSLNSNQVATVLGSNSFTNGLVFDSRVFSPLSSVPPVALSDSSAFQMQHMAVIKDFRINHTVTNFVTVTAPMFTLISTNVLRWSGQSNITYSVKRSTNLVEWIPVGTASSSSNTITFSLTNNPSHRSFYRVSYP